MNVLPPIVRNPPGMEPLQPNSNSSPSIQNNLISPHQKATPPMHVVHLLCKTTSVHINKKMLKWNITRIIEGPCSACRWSLASYISPPLQQLPRLEMQEWIRRRHKGCSQSYVVSLLEITRARMEIMLQSAKCKPSRVSGTLHWEKSGKDLPAKFRPQQLAGSSRQMMDGWPCYLFDHILMSPRLAMDLHVTYCLKLPCVFKITAALCYKLSNLCCVGQYVEIMIPDTATTYIT